MTASGPDRGEPRSDAGPTIAILGEYDTPQAGYACGHNIIAATSGRDHHPRRARRPCDLVYAIRANTVSGGSQLCGADARAVDASRKPIAPPGAQRAPEPGEQISSLRTNIHDLPIDAYVAFPAGQGIEIAGIEWAG